MNPAEYQKAAIRTEAPVDKAIERLNYPLTQKDVLRHLHAALGITTEAGEIADLLKRWLFYGKVFTQQQMEEEIGDLLWYIALAADAVGLNMEVIMERNIAKLKARYPDRFTQDAALNRDADRERLAMGHSAIAEGKTHRRTKSEVLKQRNGVIGCCSDFADHKACNCLELALDD